MTYHAQSTQQQQKAGGAALVAESGRQEDCPEAWNMVTYAAMKNYDVAFGRLGKSRFRSRFHLSEVDRRYIAEKGMATIRRHCEDFIRTRLAPANPPNDGKQTPMRGHPVFIAQHACACCCRDCLAKWWKVPRGVAIPAERQQGIVDFLMAWIERENAPTASPREGQRLDGECKVETLEKG